MNEYIEKDIKIAIVLFLTAIFTLTGCGSGGSGSSESTNEKITLSSAKATSNHYLEVTLDKAVTQDELNELSFSIIASNGESLAIKQLTLSDSGTALIIETDSQASTQYTLYYGKAGTSNTVDISTGIVSVPASIDTTYDYIAFQGSVDSEPYIQTVIALNNTTLLVTMSDGMLKTSVEKNDSTELTETIASAYRIVASDNREDVGDVTVTSALLDPVDETRIILTTSSMSDIQYFLTIANIYSQSPKKLIHPARNKLSFFGIVADDTTGPQLLRVVSTGNTSANLYFSEPLSDNADDLLNFKVCASVFIDDNCLNGNILNITGAELQAHNTLVSLTTFPQQSGIDYKVRVANVTDRATPAPGNLINTNPSDANFIGSGKGAPQVSSALAEDNTHVIILFSERMSNDVLGNGDPAVVETVYRIDSPDLNITMVERVDEWRVRLTTTPQQREEYTVTVKNVQSTEGLLINPEKNSVAFVGVAGRDIEKPVLLGAKANSTNTATLYFSESLSDAARDTRHYTIQVASCPADDTGCIVGTELNIVSAQLDVFETQVILTTGSQQPRVEYSIVVNENVTDKAMPLPHNGIDTGNNTASFGILLDDKDAPSILRADVISTSEITLSFDDSMGTNATDPNNYTVCAVAPVNDSCPDGSRLSVLSAELSEAGTQVLLKTLPMIDATNYSVIVNPAVADATGNVMDKDKLLVVFRFDGATAVADASVLPHVVGAISTGNTTVNVSFSSIMGSSALNPQNYVFTQENVNSEVGTLYVTNLEWADAGGTSVALTTTAQNEVTYRVTVVNVKDYFGNPLDSKRESLSGVLYDPVSAVFPGTPPTMEMLTLESGDWEFIDKNNNGKVDAGDTVNANGKTIVLTNNSLSNGVIDNWVDVDNSGTLSTGDTVYGMIDSDGDGLSDNEELRGLRLAIQMSSGETIYREVTSDPTKTDTDGDGLNDLEEWAYAIDPRSSDTDADGIGDYTEWNVIFSGPADQDSDDDGLQDGLEHTFYHTSPILADTDGDQLDDAQELLELNRDPRIADLPDLKIHVGSVNLQIDERYTYVNENGETVSNESSTNTSLSSGENTSFSNSMETMEESMNSYTWDAGFGIRDSQIDIAFIYDRFFIELGVGGTHERNVGTTIQVDSESARESQQAYENSLARGSELSASNEVTRELLSARISASISVENIGNVAMTVKNLEISVLQVDPQDPDKLKPIATLVAESSLLLGNDLEINLGPFNKSKGPFIFTNESLYPNLVETLMRNPTSLVFKVVNYDIDDEYERNFAFTSQLARDRTAGIIFDFGELGSEEHYVSTNGVYDTSEANVYLGGFDDAGKPKGLPLGYLLENVLGINKHDASQDYIDAGADGVLDSSKSGDDVEVSSKIQAGSNGVLDSIVLNDDRLRSPSISTGIIAGADKRVDTIAVGDDVQLVPFGSTGVAPKTMVIDPGNNGVLESITAGDDRQEFVSGYELRQTCGIDSTSSDRISEFCTVSENGCSCDGPKGLYRVKTFRNGDFGNAWYARFNGDVAAAADFDSIIVKPGQDMRLAFLQDLDKDGLFAHEEFLYGSTDSSVNQLNNSLFGPKIDAYLHAKVKSPQELSGEDDFADSMDSDRDGIGDFAEAKLGWLISRNGELKRVFSHPGLADSDSDGLWDIQEQNLSDFCQQPIEDDLRQDALCSGRTVSQAEATGIIVGKDGKLDTTKSGDDEYALFDLSKDSATSINQGLLHSTVVILPGKDGVINTVIAGDDLYINTGQRLPATDPLLSDTDQDNVSDGDELFGYAAAMSIVEGEETESNGTITWGIANTRALGDDVQRVFPGSQTKINTVIVSAGANGILETLPEGDDKNTEFWYIAPGSDRTLDCEVDATDSVQNYENGADKLDPYVPAIWNKDRVSAPSLLDDSCFVSGLGNDVSGKDIKLLGKVVTTDPLRHDSDNDRILDGFEVAIGSDPTIDDGNDFRDTDQDGLSDAEELEGWVVKVNGSITGKLVRSNAALPDTDYDGLPDFVERDIGTDPTRRDTDNDGLDDYAEFRSVERVVNFDVNADNVIDENDTLTYSVYDYAYMSNVFTGFSLTVNPVSYNTNPNEADSDADGLTDYAELVTGYRIKVNGENFLGTAILTDPNNKDSDGDGLNDGDEATGNGKDVITNANSSDTDGDGRSDSVELADGSLTDPLVQDAQITVSYDSIFAANMDDCSQTGGTLIGPDGTEQPCPDTTNLLWWFYATGDNGEGGIPARHLLSSSDEFAYVPDGGAKAVAAGFNYLISTAGLADGEVSSNTDNLIPGSNEITYGLTMWRTPSFGCTSVDADTSYQDCVNNLTAVDPLDTKYWNYPTTATDATRFEATAEHQMTRWTGNFQVPVTGNYTFFAKADDSIYLYIDTSGSCANPYDKSGCGVSLQTKNADNTWNPDGNNLLKTAENGNPVTWGSYPGDTQVYSSELYLEGGKDYPITIDYRNENFANGIYEFFWIRRVDGIIVDIANMSLGSFPSPAVSQRTTEFGSYGCVGIERSTRQGSYISLTRPSYVGNSIPATLDYEPGLPYYGSAYGAEGFESSEMLLFRQSVEAGETHVGTGYNYDRFYIDVPADTVIVSSRVGAAMDLSASRGIIDNLVRPDYEVDSSTDAAVLGGATGARYYQLSEAGKRLYRQLATHDRFGQQDFIVRPNENVEISGILMKVDDISQLSDCPVGAEGVVVQFGASCIKRFSKTISYSEAVESGSFSLSLRDMQTETYSTTGSAATGCDIELTTRISNY